MAKKEKILPQRVYRNKLYGNFNKFDSNGIKMVKFTIYKEGEFAVKRIEKTTDLEKRVRTILSNEKKRVSNLKKEVLKKQNTKIFMRYRNDKPYFYKRFNGKEKGISRDEVAIRKLIRREYIEAEMKALDFNINLLEDVLGNFRKVDMSKLTRMLSVKGMPKYLYTKAQVEWMTEPYQRNPYHPEHLRYSSTNGVLLRSKSEQAIANRLEARGIPYRAEPPMNIAGRIVYSDFVILLHENEIKIWEHFGLMDDEEYRQNAMDKIEDYRKSGFVQHKNLICTREEDIQNADDIDQIIDRFLIR